MAVQPDYHWQFSDPNNITQDSIQGVQAIFHRITPPQHGWYGRIGKAIKVNGNNALVNFGKEIGQFGEQDFTLAFGLKITDTHGENDMDIIGNRGASGHGNFVSVRLIGKARIKFEVDQDNKGTHYLESETSNLPISNKHWHHLALVRKGTTISTYFNGELVKFAEIASGTANINNGQEFRLGDYRRGTPVAFYEDVRIYHQALNAQQIQALVQPSSRPLNAGEIELIATDDAAILLNQDEADLSQFSGQFKQVRLGKTTGVTLYNQPNFNGTAQTLSEDIPEIRFSRLNNFPCSLQIWSTVGVPFTGNWLIKSPDGEYLSRSGRILATSGEAKVNQQFRFHYHVGGAKPQLIPVSDEQGVLIKVNPKDSATCLLVDDDEPEASAFSITDHSGERWLVQQASGEFNWSDVKAQRSLFYRVAKIAEHEGQVGELLAGEVALYQNRAYWGQAWILSNTEHDVSGNFLTLANFDNLNNQVSSLRLGPNTGVTLFANDGQQVDEKQRNRQIEDLITAVPDLKESQIGDNNLSALKIFSTLAPEDVFASFSTQLSEDYHLGEPMDDPKYSAYRTIIRCKPEQTEVRVSATDLTVIEVEGERFEIDEVRSVTLKPNEIGNIMITSEAEGLSTPGLKLQTPQMAENEQVVIFPDQQLHKQLAELEDDAIWNGQDAQGNPLVDQKAFSREEVASVQNTMKRVITLTQTQEMADVDTQAAPGLTPVMRSVSKSVATQTARSEMDTSPWALNFSASAPAAGTNSLVRSVRSASLTTSTSSSAALAKVWEEKMNQSDFEQMLKGASALEEQEPKVTMPAINPVTKASSVDENGLITLNVTSALRARRGRVFRRIRDAVKSAVKVTLGFVKDVMNVLVDVGGEIIRFALDTAKKIAEFVESVVEKVISGIKQFIEFLRFLFNWDDFLEAQRFLVNTINSAFDSAADMVAAAKPVVSAFVDDVQESLADGVNHLIRKLGGDPDAPDQGSKSGLPEAAEWFFNLFLSQNRKSNNEQTLTDANKDDESAGDAFQRAFEHLLDALKDAVGVGLEVFEGIVETIETFIANPTKPQLALIEILEAIREVGIKVLDLGEDLVLAFLELVVGVIRLLKQALNADIRLPLISRLFELIGGGKLTLLNVIALLVAIPSTIMGKILFGEKLFKDVDVPDLKVETALTPAAPEFTRQLSSRSLVQSERQAEEPTEVTEPEPSLRETRLARGFGVIALYADLTNGLISAILDVEAEGDNAGTGTFGLELFSIGLSWISWLGSFPSSLDKPGGYPYKLHKITKSKSKEIYFERVLWAWRTAVLTYDSLYLIGARIVNLPERFPIQRSKRGNQFTVAIIVTLTLVDISLMGAYQHHAGSGNKRGRAIAAEAIATLPTLASIARAVTEDAPPANQYAAAGVAATDVVVALTSYILGTAILIDET